MGTSSSDVIVIGAGAIGAAVAWRCAQRGLAVTTVDPDPDRHRLPAPGAAPQGARPGAWRTAAGMLAPVTELHYAEEPLLRLNLDSLARYPAFAAELTEATGLDPGFLECGTIAIAWDSADLAALRDLEEFGAGLGLTSTMLTGRELRELEPALAPGLPGGLLAEDDHQIDPRRLHAALVKAGDSAGVVARVGLARPEVAAGRVRGVVLDDGTRLAAGTVVVATGAWSAAVCDIPGVPAVPVRPVKGQTLRLQLTGPTRLAHVVRGHIKGVPIYLVPRGLRGPAGGQGEDSVAAEVVVGASSEESGFDQRPRAGAVYELLRDAESVFPELAEAVLSEVCTGLRPGSPDNAPLVGPSGIPGLVYATGHYRNGILLTPVTADAVAELVTTGSLPPLWAAFAPNRFDQEVAAC